MHGDRRDCYNIIFHGIASVINICFSIRKRSGASEMNTSRMKNRKPQRNVYVNKYCWSEKKRPRNVLLETSRRNVNSSNAGR